MKETVYKAWMRPLMLFGLETEALRKRQETELEIAEVKMLRFSMEVRRMDRMRNENIRRTADVRCFGEKVRSQTAIVWTCTEKK